MSITQVVYHLGRFCTILALTRYKQKKSYCQKVCLSLRSFITQVVFLSDSIELFTSSLRRLLFPAYKKGLTFLKTFCVHPRKEGRWFWGEKTCSTMKLSARIQQFQVAIQRISWKHLFLSPSFLQLAETRQLFQREVLT